MDIPSYSIMQKCITLFCSYYWALHINNESIKILMHNSVLYSEHVLFQLSIISKMMLTFKWYT